MKRKYEVDVLSQVFSAALEFYATCGLSRTDIEDAFNDALTRKRTSRFPSNEVIMVTSDCLRQWHTLDRYTDDNGSPLPLPKSGPLSLTSLARECGVSDVSKIIVEATRLGLILRKGKSYVPAARHSILPYEGSAPLWHTSLAVHRALKAMTRNIICEKKSEPLLFSQAAHQVALNKKHIPMFRRFVSEQGSEFIHMVDDWMAQHRGMAVTDKTIPVSVHTFAWIEEDQPPTKSRAKLPAKKRAKVVKAKRRDA